MIVEFAVVGAPAPKGSKRGYVRGGRVVLVEASKREKPWEEHVHWVAREHRPSHPAEGPVGVELRFTLPRPGRLGKRRTGVCHDRRPDLDKLTRTVLDALTGVLWVDDSQVSGLQATKHYADPGEPAGIWLRVCTLYTEVAG